MFSPTPGGPSKAESNAEYLVYRFAQSGNYELAVDWNRYPGIRDWLAHIREEPRWKHPYELLPGHPIPGRK